MCRFWPKLTGKQSFNNSVFLMLDNLKVRQSEPKYIPPFFGLESQIMLLSQNIKSDSLAHCCFTQFFQDIN